MGEVVCDEVKYPARPVFFDDKYRIAVTKDGETQCLGKWKGEKESLLFKWVEYDTEEEAIQHIEKAERLYYQGGIEDA